MDKNIYEPTPTFDFSQLYLANPAPIQGGSYFTKLLIGDKNNLYLQLPKCKTKAGIIKTGKKYYCDLLFSHNEDTDLIQWLESLENTCRELIGKKKDLWFQNADETDLDSMLTSIMRLYKSGTYVLVRVFLPYTPIKNKESSSNYKCLIFDENETIKGVEDVTNDNYIIPLVCFNGIKFSSKDFKIEIHLTQAMLLDKEPDINMNCRIKRPLTQNNSEPVEEFNNKEDIALDESSVANAEIEVSADNAELTATEATNSESTTVDTESTTVETVEPETVHVEAAHTETAHAEGAHAESIDVDTELTNESVNEDQDISDLEKPNTLEEINFDYQNAIKDEISLKKPSDVYIEIYKAARSKAKLLKTAALEAFLDANQIKSKYMLNDLDIDSSDDEDFDPEAESLAES